MLDNVKLKYCSATDTVILEDSLGHNSSMTTEESDSFLFLLFHRSNMHKSNVTKLQVKKFFK